MQSIHQLIEAYFNTYSELGLLIRPKEILLNGTKSVQVVLDEDNTISLASPFNSQQELIDNVQDFVLDQGLRLDPNQPANGGSLSIELEHYHQPQTLRWHALIPPISRDGALLSVRHIYIDDLSSNEFAIPPKILEQIHHQIILGRSVIVAGPTGSGKSSLLSCLMRENAANERLIILETLAELPATSDYWIRICARSQSIEGTGKFSLEEALEESLRLRPDRIVLGEIRGQEAKAWYRALQVCSKGCSTSLHCSKPKQIVHRLSDLSGINLNHWQELFEEVKPLLICLSRGRQRFHSAYRFRDGKFQRTIRRIKKKAIKIALKALAFLPKNQRENTLKDAGYTITRRLSLSHRQFRNVMLLIRPS